jgi:hypothetical protein
MKQQLLGKLHQLPTCIQCTIYLNAHFNGIFAKDITIEGTKNHQLII